MVRHRPCLLLSALVGPLTERPRPALARDLPASTVVQRSAQTGAVRFIGADRRHPIAPSPGVPHAPVLVWSFDVSDDAALRRRVLVNAHDGRVVTSLERAPAAKSRTICDPGNRDAQLPCTTSVLTEGGTYSGSVPDVRPAYDFSGATYDYFMCTAARSLGHVALGLFLRGRPGRRRRRSAEFAGNRVFPRPS